MRMRTEELLRISVSQNGSLPPKVCRSAIKALPRVQAKQVEQAKFVRKDDLFSWQCYGSEIVEVADLSDNASLENCTIHAQLVADLCGNRGKSV